MSLIEADVRYNLIKILLSRRHQPLADVVAVDAGGAQRGSVSHERPDGIRIASSKEGRRSERGSVAGGRLSAEARRLSAVGERAEPGVLSSSSSKA